MIPLFFLLKSKGNLPLGTVKKFHDGKIYAKIKLGESGWEFIRHSKTKGPKAPKGRRLHMVSPWKKEMDKEQGKRRKAYVPHEFRQ